MSDPITPAEWAPPSFERHPHDHKGYSEEKCVRCGWVMGMTALNCQNNDTPHVFPSQRAVLHDIDALHQPNWHDNSGRKPSWCHECESSWPCDTHLLIHPMTLDEAIWVLGAVHK